jgi:hypothetical protein
VRRACGYVARSGGADPQITVREELVTQCLPYRLPRARAAERAEEPARELDLAGLLDRPCGALSGGRPRAPLPGVLIGFAFVALLTVSLASLSYALAMRLDTPQGFGPAVNALTMPSMLLSGLMLPMSLGPAWLDVLSHLMPFRYLVDAVRDAYVGAYTTGPMLYGVLVAVAFAALSVAVGTRVFRTAGA